MLEKLQCDTNIHGLISPGKSIGGAELEINVAASSASSLDCEFQDRLIDVQAMYVMSQLGPNGALRSSIAADIKHIQWTIFLYARAKKSKDFISNRMEILDRLGPLFLLGIVIHKLLMA